jgi:hypothetical protein
VGTKDAAHRSQIANTTPSQRIKKVPITADSSAVEFARAY